jgi:hypothetical protein
MPVEFQQFPLWMRTLAHRENDPYDAPRSTLRETYLQMRQVVIPLAASIAKTMPLYTDHSIDHADSLWDTAALVTGEQFPLNPAEAFVLGGAFLLHDLGMGLAAYPDGLTVIESDPLYKDLLALGEGREDSAEQTSKDDQQRAEGVRNEALAILLRLRHAKQANRLVSQLFRMDNGEEFRLIENTALRAAFGSLIGEIAESHWDDANHLPDRFPEIIGSNPTHPTQWEVDPLKLACVLRLADAAHIDGRRAPLYLHAFTKPTGVSEDHWYFQQRLTRPRTSNDRLIFTGTEPFEQEKSAAWWLAFETIQMIDTELRKVDALCADLGKDRFQARSVAGAEAPGRFAAKYVKTAGWSPIDAQLRVSQVSDVISRLGGTELYGRRPDVAMRELIANAADAVKARVIQYGIADMAVKVSLKEVDGAYWLTVEDRGIGMSSDGLVASLTDFGLSHWQSPKTISEYPGLLAKGFKPTGRFGIGFFSVFMVADWVEVRSLKSTGASKDTHVLVFPGGLKTRPLLRNAEPDEYLHNGGTKVRARLREHPLSRDGLFGTDVKRESIAVMLREALTTLCALAEVDLLVQGPEDDDYVMLVMANDWKTLPPRDLFKRIYRTRDSTSAVHREMYRAYEEVFAEHVTNILDDDGELVGRAILAAGLDDLVATDIWWWPSPFAPVYVGGFEADSIADCLGVFAGSPIRADRFSAFPIAKPEALRRWAESQAELIRTSRFATSQSRYGAGDLARSVGVDVPFLPCGYIATGEINPDSLIQWLKDRDQVLLISAYELYVFHREDGRTMFIDRTRGREVLLPDDAIVLNLNPSWFFPEEVLPRPKDTRFSNDVASGPEWNSQRWLYHTGKAGSLALVVDAMLQAWDCTAAELADGIEWLDYGKDADRRIEVRCTDGVGTVRLEVYRVSRNWA